MSALECTIELNAFLRTPLIDLPKAQNLKPILIYIARFAPPCIAESLMDFLTTSLMVVRRCTRDVASKVLHKLIALYC